MDVVGHQAEGQEPTAHRFTVDQGDQAGATAAGQIQRLRQVRETAVDAEQFVAACQALAGGVDQHHDRSMGMRGGAGQHGFGQCHRGRR
ncbi:hypothetical protein G6F40_015691 [Rhizopus arrhizus]|nr:hypothetical protein G6F40_015691 [Rhizopus arrhizus]